MAKSGNRNSSGSEKNSGNSQKTTQEKSAPSQQTSRPSSRPSSTDTGSTIQRVSNPYTGNFSGTDNRPTPQAHQGGDGGFSDGYFGQTEVPQVDWSEYDKAEQAYQAREIANAKQRLENAAIEKQNEAIRAANAAQEVKNAHTRDVNASRLKKANDLGVVRENFQRTKEHRVAVTKQDLTNKRPHCMPRPKRGKSGSGKGKGFVPFC